MSERDKTEKKPVQKPEAPARRVSEHPIEGARRRLDEGEETELGREIREQDEAEELRPVRDGFFP